MKVVCVDTTPPLGDIDGWRLHEATPTYICENHASSICVIVSSPQHILYSITRVDDQSSAPLQEACEGVSRLTGSPAHLKEVTECLAMEVSAASLLLFWWANKNEFSNVPLIEYVGITQWITPILRWIATNATDDDKDQWMFFIILRMVREHKELLLLCQQELERHHKTTLLREAILRTPPNLVIAQTLLHEKISHFDEVALYKGLTHKHLVELARVDLVLIQERPVRAAEVPQMHCACGGGTRARAKRGGARGKRG